MAGISLCPILTDEFEKFIDSLFLRNVLLYTLLGFVKGYRASSCTDIAIVGIGHLARNIDDATHDSDLQTNEVFRCSLDLGNRLLQIVKRTSTAWSGDILCLRELNSCRL